MQAVTPGVAIDTFPETPVTATWGFKLRIGNRNGYGNFSKEPFRPRFQGFSRLFDGFFGTFLRVFTGLEGSKRCLKLVLESL